MKEIKHVEKVIRKNDATYNLEQQKLQEIFYKRQ